jgi:hypothetical protein
MKVGRFLKVMAEEEILWFLLGANHLNFRPSAKIDYVLILR